MHLESVARRAKATGAPSTCAMCDVCCPSDLERKKNTPADIPRWAASPRETSSALWAQDVNGDQTKTTSQMRVETIQPVDGGPGTRTPVKMACSLIRRLAIAQPRLGGSRRKREEANNGETRDDGELPPSPLPFRSPKRRPTVTATTLPPSLGPVSCSPERRPIGKPWTLQSRQGVACQSAVSTSLFFSTLLDLHSGTVSSPGRTYHRDRAPNQPSNLCPSSSRLLVNTDRGEQRVNNLPKQNRLVSRTLFSPPSSSCSHPSTPQLLASKYSQPRAASHAPARLRLSLCHPHCGWTPPEAQPQSS